jgi:hypothetical protein
MKSKHQRVIGVGDSALCDELSERQIVERRDQIRRVLRVSA